jgi:hypothetical protein
MKALALTALFPSLSAVAFASDCYIAADGPDSGTCTSATNSCLPFNYVSSQASVSPQNRVRLSRMR